MTRGKKQGSGNIRSVLELVNLSDVQDAVNASVDGIKTRTGAVLVVKSAKPVVW